MYKNDYNINYIIMADYLLTDKDVEKLCGGKVITYPEINKYNDIEDLFKKYGNKIILLYIHTIDAGSVIGHWCGLLKRDDGMISFMDSYGEMPDEVLINLSKNKRKYLEQPVNHLCRLLYNSKEPVEYNEYRWQSNNRNINTCGRWVSIFLRYDKIPLKELQRLFNTLRKKGFDLDKIVTELTDYLNREPIKKG